jgi:hypothetical protein
LRNELAIPVGLADHEATDPLWDNADARPEMGLFADKKAAR